MAQRRMFSPKVVDTDAFLDMPISARELYFQFGMRADDDGFIGNPKRIMRMVGASDDDIKVLVAKRFVIPFESGVIVITSWHINNLVRKDWYQPTQYQEEVKKLALNNGSYKLVNEMLPNSSTEVRLGKVSLGNTNTEREVSATPARETESFLSSKDEQEATVEYLVGRGIDKQVAWKELLKFVSYWSEKSHDGKKARWQKEKTFEVKRRLVTWFSRVGGFQPNKGREIMGL